MGANVQEVVNPQVVPETVVPEPPAAVAVPCAIFSRVVGYLSEISGWNTGKKQEWQDRVTYNLDPEVWE